MSWCDRRTFLVALAALPAAGCGFAPAYAPGGPAEGLLGQVTVDAPTDKHGFDLVERLEERLGRSRQGRYRLSYRIETETTGLAITPDNSITRYNIDGTAYFALHDAASDAILVSGEVSTFTSYSASGTTVSTAASARDANERLMRLLADQIVMRLVAASASLKSEPGLPSDGGGA